MKRAALYVRDSQKNQKINGLSSIDSQISTLKEYCQKNSYSIADVYNDEGYPARKNYTERPEMVRMLEDCKRQRIDIILFTTLDRCFRSIEDYHEIQEVLDQCGVPWRAILEDYETETAYGALKLKVMLSVAQSESDCTGDEEI